MTNETKNNIYLDFFMFPIIVWTEFVIKMAAHGLSPVLALFDVVFIGQAHFKLWVIEPKDLGLV